MEVERFRKYVILSYLKMTFKKQTFRVNRLAVVFFKLLLTLTPRKVLMHSMSDSHSFDERLFNSRKTNDPHKT